MSGSDSLAVLVSKAQEGDQDAWNTIVERFLPLVGAIARQHRLAPADGDDVGQTVWLRLVEHLGDLREPAALPGWIRTTARNECLRLLAARGRTRAVDPQEGGLDTVTDDVADAELLAAERRQALRDASPSCPTDGASCSSCCSSTHRSPTRRSAVGWVSRSAASARPGPGPSRSCASRATYFDISDRNRRGTDHDRRG